MIFILFFYLLFPGIVLCRLLGIANGKAGVREQYVVGGLFTFLIFAALATLGIWADVSFPMLSKIALILTIALPIASLLVIVCSRGYRVYVRESIRAFVDECKMWKTTVLIVAAFALAAGVYMVHPLHATDGSDTPELVVTILDTQVTEGINVFTGEPSLTDENLQMQTSVLPMMYAWLCDWTNMSPADLLFGVIPYSVLLFCFCVMGMFADRFLGGDRDRRAVAFLLFALVTVCGNGAYMNTSYGILHLPYEPMTMFSSMILPLIFLFVYSREHVVLSVLAILDGMFLAGTQKGLMIIGAQLLCMGLAFLVRFLVKRRNASWM